MPYLGPEALTLRLHDTPCVCHGGEDTHPDSQVDPAIPGHFVALTSGMTAATVQVTATVTVLPQPPVLNQHVGHDLIGGQTRADFFKSLRESAKSAFGALFADFFRHFADFLQTFFDVLQTFCRLYLIGNHFYADFLQTFCPSNYF